MTKEISMRVRVSRAIWDASKDPNRSTTSRAGDAITAFLEASAEQGWHMRPDETAKLTYEQRHAAAPKFEWDK